MGAIGSVIAESLKPTGGCEDNPTHAFNIPAWAFDRGNAQTFTKDYADAGPMVASGGESPVVVEYDVSFPSTSDYRLRVQYAAADARPVVLSIDGRAVTNVCRGATGSWNTSGAGWEESALLPLTAGKHKLKLERTGAFPHVMNLRFDCAQPLPTGWVVNRPKARKLVAGVPAPTVTLHEPAVDLPALRRAIEDLAHTFGKRYANGSRYLARLGKLEAAATAEKDIRKEFTALQREALLANPLLDFQDVLLVKRPAKSPSLGLPHNWESNCSLPGNGYDDELCVWSLKDTGAEPRTLFQPGGKFVGDVDLHWDADRVLFSMPGTNGRWQVFEMALSGEMARPHPGPLPQERENDSPRAGESAAPGKSTDSSGKIAKARSKPEAAEFRGSAAMLSLSPGERAGVRASVSPISASQARQLTGEQPDVDSYDACYLPNGKIAFTSTAMFVGVPCVNGSAHVATLYVMDPDGRNIRQLCFDQEHNWCPTVMNDGRVLYARWEYTDTPHSNSRMLFTMNPDGTSQAAYLGSGSYWPNSFFYARPIPNHPTKVVSIIGGHHDHPRMGELVVFDPQQGRLEGEPAVQRIPGFGKKVEPLIRDGLTLESWPKFLHPWPLSEKYFLVACKPSPRAPWGIYLADVFDNLLPLKQLPDFALLEPIPLRKTARPPVIPERVKPERTDAVVVLQDVYAGDGLSGVPRGTVKSLRLFTYHYAYQGMGGLLGVVGMDGPWDIKRVLGTVPVEADGSARFRVPANTPISMQPLDAEGKAVQLMRSWMTAMPGETVQCTGCHDRQNSAPPAAKSFLAMSKPPSDITPWRGPVRGFSYAREVQPVIDRHCVSCHDGKAQPDGSTPPDLRGDVKLADWSSVTPGNGGYAKTAGKFSVGYAALHRYVRRPGIESDFHVLEPLEFHADTTQLVQMLQQGHHGVQLDAEAWDRLVTWIDLNCPFHGTWGEDIASPGNQRERRRDLLKLYANVNDDPEAVPVAAELGVLGAVRENEVSGNVRPHPGPLPQERENHSPRLDTSNATSAPVAQAPNNETVATVPQTSEQPARAASFSLSPGERAGVRASVPTNLPPALAGWPFDAAEAQRRQTASDLSAKRHLELAPGITLELVRIPSGEFLMGSPDGPPDEQPVSRVRISEAFWIARTEINNTQFACFNAAHDSRVEDKNTYQFGIHGYPANEPTQPVVRVSWQEAMGFCHWLNARTGLRFTLPTEAQWEWACRAGTSTPFSFGERDTDFSGHANFADAKLREFASDPYTVDKPLANATPYDDWIPKDARFNDGALIAVAPGRYAPNAWGLQDMHGNVAEWTRSGYAPYPWAADGRDDESRVGRKVVRGGSWRDVPARGTASFRLSYESWQHVYNVGFRIVCESELKDGSIPVSTTTRGETPKISAR